MSLRFRSCFTAVLLAAIVSAKAGMASDVPTLDPHFGGADGIARVGFDVVANGSDMTEAALLADGKLLLAGTAQTGTGQYDLAFARLDAVSGAPDPGFGGGTGRVLAGLAPIQTFARVDLARDADGRILFVAGTLNSATAIVGRLSGDGTPDLAFNGTGRRFFNGGFFVDGGTQMQLWRVLPLADGKLIVLGVAVYDGGNRACMAVARLLASGATDTGFGAGRGSVCLAPALSTGAGMAYAMDGRVLDDGRLLLAGMATHSGGSGYDMSVARLLPDGQFDSGFGPGHDGWAFVGFDQGGTLADAACAMAVDGAGRIVLAGIVEQPAGFDVAVARLSASGEADAAFGLGGRGVSLGLAMSGVDPAAIDVQALADGRILVGAYADANGAALAAMYAASGQLDPRFGSGGLFVQAGPAAPASAVVQGRRLRLAGDHLYFIGNSASPVNANNRDFAATRYLLPLFRDGFDH